MVSISYSHRPPSGNMADSKLNYDPKWYLIGDADVTWLALAYRILTLGTIFLIVYIIFSLMFSGDDEMTLSDSAANITFRSSSWFQIGKWSYSLVLQPGRRKCKEAIIPIFLRFLVFALDIRIFYLSVPRSIDVLSSKVGSSQLVFNRLTPCDNREMPPCKADSLEYSGFKLAASLEICVSISSVSAIFGNRTSKVIESAKTAEV